MAITTYNAHLREWENIIRTELKVTNPALLKSGSLGILTNFLAGIKYDCLSYYNKIFQEMNIGLAQDFNSMLYHSTIYNTQLTLATPPTLVSSLVIPELNLAQVSKLKYFIPRNSVFSDNNNLSYIVDSDITIEIKSDGVLATAWDKRTGSKKLTVTRTPNPTIPNNYLYLISNTNIRQYQRNFDEFISTGYLIGDNFAFSIGINDLTTLKEINVWVNTGRDKVDLKRLDGIDSDEIENITEPNKDIIIEKYDVRYQKFGSSNTDKVVFLEIFEDSLGFETGDGIHGIVVPANAQIIVETQITAGSQGNVNNSEFLIRNVQVTESSSGQNIDNQYTTSVNGLSTTGSTGGVSAQNTEELREEILDNVSTRNSIITENDYEIAFKFNKNRPFVDAKFIDARAFVFLFNVIKRNDTLIPSTAVNFKETDLFSTPEAPFYPTYAYEGVELISPFYYKNKSQNTVEAYLLNPEVYIPWTNETLNSVINTNLFQVDLAITYDFTLKKTYVEILSGATEDYVYHFNAEQLGVDIDLDINNGFKRAIDDLYLDQNCVLLEPLTELTLKITQNGNELARFVSDGPIDQLIYKQTLYKYFKEVTITANIVDPYPVTYLDNSRSGTLSTYDNLVSSSGNFETYILRMPFYSKDYFFSLPAKQIFEEIDSYFMINKQEKYINYNTQLTQTFHNTIDIPSQYFDYLFEKNNNGVLQTPQLPIDLTIHLNTERLLTSKYKDLFDLELQIKIFIINFLKEYEGFAVSYFESDLEKAIWKNFSPLLNNISIISPLLFEVKTASLIYKDIQENLSFQDMIDFVPPYFSFGYKGINITFKS